MKRVALTGNMGSGKSIVARIINYLGIPVFDADSYGHRAYEDPVVQEQVSHLLNSDLLDPDGNIDRKKLAALAFKDEEILKKISAIIHPWVMARFEDWITELSEDIPVAIMESAIIHEYGLHKDFDEIVLVTAPKNLRIARVCKRDGISKEEAVLRMQNQWPEDWKKGLSQIEIENDERQMVLPQVIDLAQRWTRPAL